MRRTIRNHFGLWILVVAAGWTVSAWAADGEAQSMALLGVALSGASGFFALALKALARHLKTAIAVMVLVFGARALLVIGGGLWAAKVGGGAMPFVYGFFGTYFPLQWVEISLVAALARVQKAAEQTQ